MLTKQAQTCFEFIGPHKCGVTRKDPTQRWKSKKIIKNLQIALDEGGNDYL